METKEYTIDPEGDVLIILRNPNAPFAPLGADADAESFVPNPTRVDNEEGEDSAGRAPNASTLQLDLLNFPSPNEVMIGAWRTASKATPVTGGVASQGPAAENEPETRDGVDEPELSRLGDDEIDHGISEPPTDAQESPEIHLRVSSAHLRLASPYFKTALDGPFKESHRAADGLRRVYNEGWDVEALLIVMRIVHGKNRDIPRSLDLEMLAKIAVVVNYYQCREALEAFAEIWAVKLEGYKTPKQLDRDAILLLLVSWVFQWAGHFEDTTRIAVGESTGLLDTLGLPIPEIIIKTIDYERRKVICQSIALLDYYFDNSRKDPPGCCFECNSMYLGALMLEMWHKKELHFYGSVNRSFVGHSAMSATDAVRNIQTPSPQHDGCGSIGLLSGVFEFLEKIVEIGSMFINKELSIHDFIGMEKM